MNAAVIPLIASVVAVAVGREFCIASFSSHPLTSSTLCTYALQLYLYLGTQGLLPAGNVGRASDSCRWAHI